MEVSDKVVIHLKKWMENKTYQYNTISVLIHLYVRLNIVMNLEANVIKLRRLTNLSNCLKLCKPNLKG